MANVVVRRKPLKDAWPNLVESQQNLSRSISAPAENDFQHQNIMAQLPSKRDNAFATVRSRNHSTDGGRGFYETVRGWMTISRITGDMERGFADDGTEDDEMDLERVKELACSMAEKRARLQQDVPSSRAGNTNHLKLQGRKFTRRMNNRLSNFFSSFHLWQRDMKKIEGNYGTGVVAYFIFIKWLTLLNFFIFLMLFLFITLPTILSSASVTCDNSTSYESHCCSTLDEFPENVNPHRISNCCNIDYSAEIKKSSMEFLDVIQGTGRMEYTLFFYGFHDNFIFNYSLNGTEMYYNFPMAYVLIVVIVLCVSLFLTVRAASRGFTYKFHAGEEEFYQYCNLIFGGWDFCIDNENAAHMKKAVLCNEIQACLDTEKLIEEKKNRTAGERRKLIAIRVVINLIQLAILGGCGYGIYTVFGASSRILRDEENLTTEETFLYEFLPSITIVCINVISPILFKFLIVYERYSPNFSIFVLLARTIFLRLASLFMFYVSMYGKINESNTNEECVLKCWETFVGQQIYRLAITDFATHILLTFFVNWPRSYLAKSYGHKNKFVRFVGAQTFDLPKHVLDVVYTQTLCWLGSFFAPLLPVMFVVIFFAMFYIKKFVCLVIAEPGSIIHRTSRSKFMIILLVGFVVATIPVAYAVGEMAPSISCGPFRGMDNPWLVMYEAFQSTPDWLVTIVEYIPSPGVSIAIFIILIIFLYYYTATINANKHMVKALKAQLVLEGHDKQLLSEKLRSLQPQQVQRYL